MNRLLLIDGDILVFKWATAAEKECDWGDGMFTNHADMEWAQDKLTDDLGRLVKKLDADDFVICFSCPEGKNFRKDLYPEYKANRKNLRQPLIRKELTTWVKEQWDCKDKIGIEADDVMGILATNPKLYPGDEKIIVSKDKDLMQVPGQVYDGEKLHEISTEQGDYLHMLQTLTGDNVDNYPGCPSIGPVRAKRILEKGIEWSNILEAFDKQGCDEADALIMARIARICRYRDFNYKLQEPKLWTPK